jgi:DNA processing protein
MSSARDRAALVAVLRLNRRPWLEYAEAIERAGSALPVLQAELEGAGGQISLLANDAESLLDRATAEIEEWEQQGLRLLTVLDEDYPENLRTVHDRPPFVFTSGALVKQDARSVAVIGTRRATREGLSTTTAIAEGLVAAGFAVVSGLAAGIDTAAHQAALAAGARTVAVIGTGLRHAYPPENAALQAQIAAEGAVVSQFWPETPPSRETFPLRNAVMSGVALGSVVVEASHRSGARLQARLALAHGRPVFLMSTLLEQTWAQEMADRAGVHVVDGPEQIISTIERVDASDALVE